MIFDSLDNRSSYEDIPGLKQILDALAEIHDTNMPQARVVLDDGRAFLNPVILTTKPLAETRFEAHRRYIDIHCVIQGEEEIIVNDIHNVKEIQTFSILDDIGFYDSDQGTVCILKPGQFLVCFPQDAHRVAIAREKPASVMKLVGKLKVNQ